MKNTNLLATIVVGLILLCFGLPAKAQHPCQDEVYQNSLWSAPTNLIEYPIGSDPVVIPLPNSPDPFNDEGYSGELPSHSHNAIHDQNGNLLFFVVDDRLYNRDGYKMAQFNGYAYGDLNDGNIKGNSEFCIVPDPADCERYYIFTSTIGTHANSAFYSLLDMSEINANDTEIDGDLVTSPLYGGTFESVMATIDFFDTGEPPLYDEIPYVNFHFAATPLRNDNSRLVLMYTSGQGTLYKMKIDDNGIHPIGVDGFSNSSGKSRAEMEVFAMPNGNYKVAMGDKHAIQLCELDNNGDMIPGSEEFVELWDPLFSDTPYVKGLEFSESGNYLYLTHHHIPTNAQAIQYVDLSTMQIGTISLPNGGEDFQYSQIELGADGKLYFAWEDGLAALSDPDNPNVNNFEPNEIFIQNYHLSDAGYPGQDPLKVYLLPDQIDGMNYFDHFLVEEDDECCLHHPPYDAYNATATTSATWSPGNNPFSEDPECDVVLISNELRIPDGIHITIEDMRFEFNENARVIIEPGGTLTMDNSIFTYGPCGDRMWLGIEVWGTPSVSQYVSGGYQGHLHMRNNSIIEHAYVGALAGSREGGTASNLFWYEKAGGIIRGFDSRFRNNMRDVLIQNHYSYGVYGDLISNRSRFNNCDFLTDGLLNHPEVFPMAHATFYRVHNVRFDDCSFRNTASFQNMPIADRGTGIYAIVATFKANGNNDTYEPADDALDIDENAHQSFYQLDKGVLSIGNENHFFTVNKMEFQLNKTGILVLGSCNETITYNNFEVPEAGGNYPSLYPVDNIGAYLMNSYLFTVEENTFFSTPTVSRNGGLVVDNSSMGNLSVENEAYRNHFSYLDFGIGVKRDNRGERENAGFQARCNMFAQIGRADIALAPESEWRDDQGSASSAYNMTNNSFSDDGYACGSFYDVRVDDDYGILSGPNLMFQYWHLDHPVTKPDMDYMHPTCPQSHMENILSSGYIGVTLDYEEHCPSNFSSGGGIKWSLVELEVKLATAESNLGSAQNIYQATVDGGETGDIIDLLENVFDEESVYLRDLLLTRYPLSKKALMAAIDAADSFDPWHLTQVLVANSRLPGNVYQFLKDNEVLAPFFMQFVDDAQTSGMASFRTLLKSEISFRSYEKSQAERAINRHYLHHADSLDGTAWSGYVESSDAAYYQLYSIGANNDKGETGAAQTLLDSMELNPHRTEWVQFMIDLAVADTVTASDISTGWNFFDNKPSTIGHAWGWLTAQGELDSIPSFEIEPELRSFSLSSPDDPTKTERWLEAWPNPAKDRVVLTYPREADGIGTVQVFGPKGEFIREFAASDVGFQEINVTDWSPGIYFAKLIVNSKTFDTVKISVVK